MPCFSLNVLLIWEELFRQKQMANEENWCFQSASWFLIGHPFRDNYIPQKDRIMIRALEF